MTTAEYTKSLSDHDLQKIFEDLKNTSYSDPGVHLKKYIKEMEKLGVGEGNFTPIVVHLHLEITTRWSEAIKNRIFGDKND